jgi:hypothetical protein
VCCERQPITSEGFSGNLTNLWSTHAGMVEAAHNSMADIGFIKRGGPSNIWGVHIFQDFNFLFPL